MAWDGTDGVYVPFRIVRYRISRRSGKEERSGGIADINPGSAVKSMNKTLSTAEPKHGNGTAPGSITK